MGIACLWLQSPIAFTTVGIASIIASIARLLSLFIDRSFSIKNVGGVFTEAILYQIRLPKYTFRLRVLIELKSFCLLPSALCLDLAFKYRI
ncbi:MAG: hypothetical protein QNJ41_01515 [Xenococcaceae cyanobacterium MO_188.B32]|nr:hypothetical protein [Xenococcaceae cyanobacterium MO_188.B32]